MFIGLLSICHDAKIKVLKNSSHIITFSPLLYLENHVSIFCIFVTYTFLARDYLNQDFCLRKLNAPIHTSRFESSTLLVVRFDFRLNETCQGPRIMAKKKCARTSNYD